MQDSVALALQSYLGGQALDFHGNFLATTIFVSPFSPKRLDSTSISSVVSLPLVLMRFSTSGTMALLIGRKRNVLGRLSRRKNGPWSSPNPQRKRQKRQKNWNMFVLPNQLFSLLPKLSISLVSLSLLDLSLAELILPTQLGDLRLSLPLFSVKI